MKHLLLALALLSLTGVQALADDNGPVQVQVRKDADAAVKEAETQSEYIEYQDRDSKLDEKQSLFKETQPYQAADGSLMFNLTEGQSRWEYGF